MEYDADNKICTSCVLGFEFNKTMNKCVKLANSCLKFDQDSQTCTECIEGWGLDEKSLCFACPSNSISCDGHIVKCEPKRYFDSVNYDCPTCDASCDVC